MLKGAFFLKFLMKFQIYMAQGLKLPLFSGVLNILGKNFRMEDSDICGSESYSSTMFLGQIWLHKDSGRFSATQCLNHFERIIQNAKWITDYREFKIMKVDP